LVVAFASAVRPFRKAGRRHGQADAGLAGQEAGGGRGVAGVLLMTERDHAHALGLCHPAQVGHRDARQAEDRVDVVELERVDDQMETIGQGLFVLRRGAFCRLGDWRRVQNCGHTCLLDVRLYAGFGVRGPVATPLSRIVLRE
jgi:hypothetical protein